MAWEVDPCVLLDIHCADPQFAKSSANCLTEHRVEGLIISPVTSLELAPAFGGNMKLQEQFLLEVGIEWPSTWILQDTINAHQLWFSHTQKKRNGSESNRPIADVSISAFAQRFQDLMTRNSKDSKIVQVAVS